MGWTKKKKRPWYVVLGVGNWNKTRTYVLEPRTKNMKWDRYMRTYRVLVMGCASRNRNLLNRGYLQTTELVRITPPVRLENRHGHWLCWMTTGGKNGLTILFFQSRFGDKPIEFQVVCPQLSSKRDWGAKRVNVKHDAQSCKFLWKTTTSNNSTFFFFFPFRFVFFVFIFSLIDSFRFSIPYNVYVVPVVSITEDHIK